MVIHQHVNFCAIGRVSSHHHLLELVEVHRPAAVLVHLLDDVVKVVLRQGVVDFAQDVLQHIVCDETLTLKKLWVGVQKIGDCQKGIFRIVFKVFHLFVVDPERFFQLLLHLLLVVLDHELGRHLKT